jgi:hypothetical protein
MKYLLDNIYKTVFILILFTCTSVISINEIDIASSRVFYKKYNSYLALVLDNSDDQ